MTNVLYHALMVASLILCLAILARFGPFEQNTPSAYFALRRTIWQALCYFFILELKWNQQQLITHRRIQLKICLGLFRIRFTFSLPKPSIKRGPAFVNLIAHKESRQKYGVTISPLDFQAVLMAMKSHYQTIYDDGFTFVLDLNQPIQ